MGIVNKNTVKKSESRNPNYKGTNLWEVTDKVVQLESRNGFQSTIDELPGKGSVKEKTKELEKKIQNTDKTSASDEIIFSTTPGFSETSTPLQPYSEDSDNGNVIFKPEKDEVPITPRVCSRIPGLTRHNTTLNKIPEVSCILQRTKSDLSQRKQINSKLDNYLGPNHQTGRNFQHEVKSLYKLTPNLDSVNSKVNSSHFSSTPFRRKRNFIEENKKAVSSPSMKR